MRGSKGIRGKKGNKDPESDQRPKAAEGFQRLPKLLEAPERSQEPREA